MNPKVDLNEMRRLDAEAPSLGYAIPSALSLSKERTMDKPLNTISALTQSGFSVVQAEVVRKILQSLVIRKEINGLLGWKDHLAAIDGEVEIYQRQIRGDER
jgi:hypothetical protein